MDALVEAARDDGVRDERVLDVIAAVPRSEFVPLELAGLADVDMPMPIPIPHGQVTTQPSLVARMIEALSLDGDERVLEIGTGYGWQAALLARLAREVFSVERLDDIAEAARAALAGRKNVHVVVGDGSEGLPNQGVVFVRGSGFDHASTFARGSRAVEHPRLGMFEDTFDIRWRWSAPVRTGAELELLVDLQREKVLFIRLAGAAPIPASSGQTIRYRLDRSGDRKLNRTLHQIIVTRRRTHRPTIDYINRRIRQGKSRREATRCLKRYLARNLYRLLENGPPLPT